MKTFRSIPAKHELTLILLAVASCLPACATSDESTPTVTGDSAVVDSFASEGGLDSSVPDVADTRPDSVIDTAGKDTRPADATSCVPGATETRACGACGSQSRFCLSEGYFTSFTDCTGEHGDVECKIGEKRVSDCDRCGKATDFCDSKTCTWVTGVCAGAGPCDPGTSESTTASCSVAAEVRTRTCSDKCTWSTFSECGIPRGWLPMAAPPSTFGGRVWNVGLWTGSKLMIWGGYGLSPSVKTDGAIYDLASDTWAMMPAAPSAMSAGRRNAMAVWTGSKMLVFGGRDSSSTAYKDGVIFDPAGASGAGSWTSMSTSPLSARFWSAAVWSTTTSELLVWGGCTSGSSLSCSSVTADGAAYNPATDTWTAIPAAPIAGRADPAFAWNGTEMIILGGRNVSVGLVDGARYDPLVKSWVKFSDPPATAYDGRQDSATAFDGKSLFLFGGRTTSTASTAQNNGAYYTPSVGWTAIPTPGDLLFLSGNKRYNSAAWFGGGKLFVYGGQGTSSSSTPLDGFGSFDPSTGAWTPIDETGAPGARGRATAVWTGREAILWGGSTSDYLSGYLTSGAIYRP